MVDLEKMTLPELKKLHKEIATAIKTYGDRERRKALAEIEGFAMDRGINIADLAKLLKGRKRAAANPKYANPQDPSQTWSGRGRQPLWFVAAIENGSSPEDLAI